MAVIQFSNPAHPAHRPPKVNAPFTGYGSTLKRIILERSGASIPCGDCEEDMRKLDRMTPAEVMEGIDQLVENIVERGKTKAAKWYQRVGATVAPAVAKLIVREWVLESIGMMPLKRKQQSVQWEYGITTVPMRRNTTLPRTIESLKAAGFTTPRLFVDGCADAVMYSELGLETTLRNPAVRTVGNWILTLWELYLRNPNADRFAIFQDDMVAYQNLRAYLDRCPYPDKGYLNLFTFASNEEVAPSKDYQGWYESNQYGRGAVALVFNREAVTTLLASSHMAAKPQDKMKGYRSVDGAIITAYRNAGWKEYVHLPSLVQHIGDESSMGNGRHAPASTFRGEDFDAIGLLSYAR